MGAYNIAQCSVSQNLLLQVEFSLSLLRYFEPCPGGSLSTWPQSFALDPPFRTALGTHVFLGPLYYLRSQALIPVTPDGATLLGQRRRIEARRGAAKGGAQARCRPPPPTPPHAPPCQRRREAHSRRRQGACVAKRWRACTAAVGGGGGAGWGWELERGQHAQGVHPAVRARAQ